MDVPCPPITPAMPIGPVSSAISSTSGVSSTTALVEQLQRLAMPGHAHLQRALDASRVVGMHGLAGLEHHVVGHVDDRVDAAQSGAPQAFLHPQRTRCRWLSRPVIRRSSSRGAASRLRAPALWPAAARSAVTFTGVHAASGWRQSAPRFHAPRPAPTWHRRDWRRPSVPGC